MKLYPTLFRVDLRVMAVKVYPTLVRVDLGVMTVQVYPIFVRVDLAVMAVKLYLSLVRIDLGVIAVEVYHINTHSSLTCVSLMNANYCHIMDTPFFTIMQRIQMMQKPHR